MKATLLALSLLPALPLWAGLEQERQTLQSDPTKAAAEWQKKLGDKPTDPWVIYNTGVASYAAGDFAKADELWQLLAANAMPDELRDQAWLQIGNVSYRLAKPFIEKEPETAVTRLEQSREAYRVTLAANKKHAVAAKNLRFVETELEKVYARLAKRLAEEGKKENSAPRAIEKLQAALTYAQQAEVLSEKSPQRQEERKEIEKALAEKYDQRAANEEKIADQRDQNNEWSRNDAQEHLQNALADFQQAQALDQQDQVAKDGEKRVREKLADSLAKEGRDEQKQGEEQARYNPQEAVDSLEKALENFEEAQAVQPEHADAKAGEKEVKEQLAQLHLDQGDRQAQVGEKQIPRNPEQAAQNLESALENFEQAQAQTPENGEIQPRIDKVEALLPELLTELGQKEQQQGEKAEAQQDLPGAIENFEKAEANFGKAEGMQPGNEPAKQGQQQAQAALERLRQQLAQQQQGQQPGKEPGQPQQSKEEAKENQEAFQSMLAKVKKEQKEVNARHSRGEKYREEREKNLRNW